MNFNCDTKRLNLRVLNGTEAKDVLRFYVDNRESFDPYEPERSENFFTEEFHRYILNYEYNQMCKGQMVRYYAYLKDQPTRLIGTISIRNIMRGSYQKCELGYKIATEYQGKGYGKEMVEKAVGISFFELNMHRVEAYCLPENVRSIRLLKSIGFEPEGLIRDYVQIQGQFRDHVLFSILHP